MLSFVHITLLLSLLVRVPSQPITTPPCSPPPQLRVQLSDVADHPVPAMLRIVRADAPTTELDIRTLDASGVAVVPLPDLAPIRVQVTGQLAGGTSLRQLGDDAQGIAYWPSCTGNVLLLRVEPTGVVIPDPQLFREDNLDAAALVTPAPTANTTASHAETSDTSMLPGLRLLLVLMLLSLGALWLALGAWAWRQRRLPK